MERDRNQKMGLPVLIISTHTLTWSVTVRVTVGKEIIDNFNSHAHVERDENAYFAWLEIFISTHTLTWSVTQFVRSWNVQ